MYTLKRIDDAASSTSYFALVDQFGRECRKSESHSYESHSAAMAGVQIRPLHVFFWVYVLQLQADGWRLGKFHDDWTVDVTKD